MAQPQKNIQIQAPGFAGLNTQDSPIGMDLSFAEIADNCVIDSLGRIASRNGFRAFTADPETSGNMGTNPVETAYEYVEENGNRTILMAGDNTSDTPALWSQDTSGNLTTITGLSASGNMWDYTSLGSLCYMAQEGEDVMVTDGATVSAMTQQPSAFTTGGITDPNIITTGFGRLFVASGTSNKSTVQWSVVIGASGLGATPWTGTGAGAINVDEYWPNGTDTIEAITVHNSYLVIFGRRSILLYSIPDSGTNQGPEYMTLADTIENMGCIARDSVTSIGTDVLFLDASGIRSLNRTIQEKSVPVGDISKNVRDQLSTDVRGIELPISAVYSPEEAMYLLMLPKVVNGIASCNIYVFDTRRPLEGGALRVTQWNAGDLRCAVRADTGKLFLCGRGGANEYTRGEDTSSIDGDVASKGIIMNYRTRSQDFDAPSRVKFPKKVDVILVGGETLDLTVSWFFDFSQAANSTNISRESEGGGNWASGVWGVASYGTPGGIISSNGIQMWGNGKNIQLGFAGEITGEPVSIQELNMKALIGRTL
tara:strand:- start:11786 stop:13402 length:1617 start_codon:yes stop_codon:yes gene_type:complete